MLLATLIAFVVPHAPAESLKPRLAVMPVAVDAAAKDRVPNVVDDYVLTAVSSLGLFEVIGQDDINNMLGFDKQKQALGCDDTTCFAELGGALGVEKLLVVKIASLGESWALTAKLIQIAGAPRVLARETKMTKDVAPATLLVSLDALVRAAVGHAGGGGAQASAPALDTSRAPETRVDPQPEPAASTLGDADRGRPRIAVEARVTDDLYVASDTSIGNGSLALGISGVASVRVIAGLWLGAGIDFHNRTYSDVDSANEADLLATIRYVFGPRRLNPYVGMELMKALWGQYPMLEFGIRLEAGLQLVLSRHFTLDAGLFAGPLLLSEGDGNTYGINFSGVMTFGG